MLNDMEAHKEFVNALKEVQILLKSAEASVEFRNSEPERYIAYIKAAILLMAGKFENFLESVVVEYVDEVNQMKLASSAIPHHLRLYHSFNLLKEFDSLKAPQKHEKTRGIFESLGILWGKDDAFDALDIECKFAYGKHGEAEVQKLFKIVGIDDVFAAIDVMVTDDSNSEEEVSVLIKVDFKGIFNSVSHIRNNIIHQDASPSITPGDVRKYMAALEAFAQELSLHLRNSLDKLAENPVGAVT